MLTKGWRIYHYQIYIQQSIANHRFSNHCFEYLCILCIMFLPNTVYSFMEPWFATKWLTVYPHKPLVLPTTVLPITRVFRNLTPAVGNGLLYFVKRIFVIVSRILHFIVFTVMYLCCYMLTVFIVWFRTISILIVVHIFVQINYPYIILSISVLVKHTICLNYL